MAPVRRLFRALILAAAMLWITVTPVSAQLQPAPQPEPGLCAPWHRCMAAGMMVLIALYALFAGAMYMWQRRGFHTVEHRQGNPEGVPAKRDE